MLRTMEALQLDLWHLLKTHLPEFEKETGNLSPYRLTTQLLKLTRHYADTHDFIAVRHCFLVANDLLTDGSASTQNAVCSVYVYGLENLLDAQRNSREVLLRLMPYALHEEYRRQVTHSLP